MADYTGCLASNEQTLAAATVTLGLPRSFILLLARKCPLYVLWVAAIVELELMAWASSDFQQIQRDVNSWRTSQDAKTGRQRITQGFAVAISSVVSAHLLYFLPWGGALINGFGSLMIIYCSYHREAKLWPRSSRLCTIIVQWKAKQRIC